MSTPNGFSWIEKPLLAALASPNDAGDFAWLRQQGIDVVLSLTEDPPRRHWVNDAGLMLVHVPMIDMQPPTPDEIDKALAAIQGAHGNNMGIAVHCGAGLGRTGVVLACYFVTKGLSAANAIARVRRLRPGSVETDEQERAIEEFARRSGV
jgi:atypical dual specificity phosphatase